MRRTRVRKREGGYEATCPSCPWLYWSHSLPAVHTEATHHTCVPVLGPRRLPPGSSVVATEQSTAIYVETPPYLNTHRMEVWL